MITKSYKIKEISKLNNKSYSKKENWDFINYLDTKNITDNEINEIHYFDVSEDKIPSRARRKVDNHDIIISTVRPNQRHFGIVRNQPENFLVSTGFITLKIDPKIATPEFIYYYLIQDDIVEYLQQIAEQSTTSYPSIKKKDIEELIINLPSLHIQEKFSYVFNIFERKLNLIKSLNKNLLIIILLFCLFLLILIVFKLF